MKHEFAIDLKGVADADALQGVLAASLPLPPDYGRNLDAFYDVLTEYGADRRIVFTTEPGRADSVFGKAVSLLLSQLSRLS